MALDKLKVGNSSYSVTRWFDKEVPYACVTYYDRNGKRKFTRGVDRTPEDRKVFLTKARKKIKEAHSGVVDIVNLPADQKNLLLSVLDYCPTITDLEEFIKWKELRSSRKETLQQVCDMFYEDKQTSGLAFSSIESLRQSKDRLLKHIDGKKQFSDVGFPELNSYHKKCFGSLSVKSKNNGRAFLVTLWNWAKSKQLYFGDDIPPARITQITGKAKKKDQKAIEVFTVDEGQILLNEAQEIFLPWVVLCGWNGLRSEEVAPKPKDDKRRLMWEDIVWSQGNTPGKIIVPLETSKIGMKRVIPLHPMTEKYLKPLGKESGAICPKNPATETKEVQRLGKLIGGWKRNGFRNSYISYRGCLIGIAKVAMESGNSERICKSNYLDATTEDVAHKWFNL